MSDERDENVYPFTPAPPDPAAAGNPVAGNPVAGNPRPAPPAPPRPPDQDGGWPGRHPGHGDGSRRGRPGYLLRDRSRLGL